MAETNQKRRAVIQAGEGAKATRQGQRTIRTEVKKISRGKGHDF